MKRFICWLTGGHIYHDLTLEVKRDPYSRKTVFKNRCLKCGKELYLRDDDKPESVERRLVAYEQQTKPLIDYYKSKGVLSVFDGAKDIHVLFAEICELLDRK